MCRLITSPECGVRWAGGREGGVPPCRGRTRNEDACRSVSGVVPEWHLTIEPSKGPNSFLPRSEMSFPLTTTRPVAPVPSIDRGQYPRGAIKKALCSSDPWRHRRWRLLLTTTSIFLFSFFLSFSLDTRPLSHLQFDSLQDSLCLFITVRKSPAKKVTFLFLPRFVSGGHWEPLNSLNNFFVDFLALAEGATWMGPLRQVRTWMIRMNMNDKLIVNLYRKSCGSSTLVATTSCQKGC